MTLLFSRSLTLSVPLYLPLSVSHHPSLRATPMRWILSVEACDILINLNLHHVLEFDIVYTLSLALYLPVCLSLSFSLACSLFSSLATSLTLPSSHTPHSLSFSLSYEPVVDRGAQRRCV